MAKIAEVHSREILDSRGHPTIATTIRLDSGHSGTAAVPAGASSSRYEAAELRDGDPHRFKGLGVLKAVALINQTLGPRLLGQDPTRQTQIDQQLISWDDSPDKTNYGANTLLSLSQAVVCASADFYHLPVYAYLQKKYYPNKTLTKIPSPTFNIINGGAHGAGNLDFQEFHLVPSARFSYRQALQIGEEIYQNLKTVLKYRRAITSVGDEGGYAPDLFTNMEALSAILEAIKPSGYELAKDVFFGLDAAADWFYKNGHYEIKDRAQPYNEEELIDYYRELINEFHLFSLEDGLHQDAWNGWAKLTESLGGRCLIVGDDLLSTNKIRVVQAVARKACNAILVKPNQIGTISETIEIINLCREQNWKIIVSHRSGETNDSFIADFAVGVLADYTKFGAPARGERVAKYNRLLEIESELKL